MNAPPRALHRRRTGGPAPAQRAAGSSSPRRVPPGLEIAGAYAWRLLALAAVGAVLIWLAIKIKLLVVPLFVAILITALVWPAFAWMRARGVPKWAAIPITVLGTLGVIAALVWLITWQISQQWTSVTDKAQETVQSFSNFLTTGPLHLSSTQIDQLLETAVTKVEEQAGALASSALSFGSAVGEFGAGSLLAVFALLCLLADGSRIWSWTTRLFPREARQAVDQAGHNGWKTLINYAKTQVTVATIDAIGIGLGAFLLGVPLSIPIAVTVFLGSFVPLVGAVVTGALAVLIALLYNGIWVAVAMAVVVVLVQQLEGHVLQPLLMGTAVNVHPLAVIMAVAGGSMLAGIPGALFAVPAVAFVNVFVTTIASGKWREDPHAGTLTTPR